MWIDIFLPDFIYHVNPLLYEPVHLKWQEKSTDETYGIMFLLVLLFILQLSSIYSLDIFSIVILITMHIHTSI